MIDAKHTKIWNARFFLNAFTVIPDKGLARRKLHIPRQISPRRLQITGNVIALANTLFYFYLETSHSSASASVCAHLSMVCFRVISVDTRRHRPRYYFDVWQKFHIPTLSHGIPGNYDVNRRAKIFLLLFFLRERVALFLEVCIPTWWIRVPHRKV